MNKLLLAIVVVAVIVGGVLWYSYEPTTEPNIGTEASAGPEIKSASDVIGTRVGTTTTGVTFENFSATSTYMVRTSGAGTAIFTVYATEASSTAQGPAAAFNFFGSNDWDCATASTTGGALNPILTTDINWYDIGYNVAELAGSQTLGASSTIAWTPVGEQGKTITLTNLNYECIRVQAAASGTVMFMQARLKK